MEKICFQNIDNWKKEFQKFENNFFQKFENNIGNFPNIQNLEGKKQNFNFNPLMKMKRYFSAHQNRGFMFNVQTFRFQ